MLQDVTEVECSRMEENKSEDLSLEPLEFLTPHLSGFPLPHLGPTKKAKTKIALSLGLLEVPFPHLLDLQDS